MLIDTHCHLDAVEFDEDRDRVVEAALHAGIERILIPAVEADQFKRTVAVAARYRCCRVALGIHPLYVGRAEPRDLDSLRASLQAGDAIAVGEIGLDYYVDDADRERQAFFFSEQLKIAREFNLPVILHIRRAQDDVLKHLRRARCTGGIAHAFNGSIQQASQFIDLGFCLGFGGAMTFEGSRRIRRLAADLPETAIVLESDAPDMSPAWARGERNEPAYVQRFACELARLRDRAPADIVERCCVNALRVVAGLA